MQEEPPSTQKAGEVFADMSRLVRLPWSCKRYMAYLTDDEMFQYLTGAKNRFSSWFDLVPGIEFALDERFFAGRPDTFLRHMGPYPGSYSARSIMRESLPGGHHLRVYTIHPTAQRSGRPEAWTSS